MVIHIPETLALQLYSIYSITDNWNLQKRKKKELIYLTNWKGNNQRSKIVIGSKNFFCTWIDLLRGQSKSNQLINRCKYPPNGCGKNQLPPRSYILQMPVYWGEHDAALSAMLNRKYWSFLTVLKSPLITQGHRPESFIKRLQYHWIYHLG